MEIIKIFANKPFLFPEENVAFIGYFDGIHLGHMRLLKEVNEYAEKHHIKKSCICFDEDPWFVLHKEFTPKYLTPFSKKLEILEKNKIDYCFLLHFDQDMMKMEPDCFIDSILNKMHLKKLVCGCDFRFAYKGQGTTETLKKGNFDVHIIDHLLFNQQKISSSIIEKQIVEGNIESANTQLGYTYNINGTVVSGKQIGTSKLGFPTANVQIVEPYVIPKPGVYSGYVKISNEYHKAMINIGYNPTINPTNILSIEAHILDFNAQIYGENIIVYFLSYLREEKKFASMEDLIHQLCLDVEKVKGEKHALRVI